MRGGTQNFYEADLHTMENNPNIRAREIGRQLPYHLQYVKDGKINVKPEVKNESE